MRYRLLLCGLSLVACADTSPATLSVSVPARLFALAPDAQIELGLTCENGTVLPPARVVLDAEGAVELEVPPCGRAVVNVRITASSSRGQRTLRWLGFSEVTLAPASSYTVNLSAEKAGEAQFRLDAAFSCALLVSSPSGDVAATLDSRSPVRLGLLVGAYTATCVGEQRISQTRFDVAHGELSEVVLGVGKPGLIVLPPTLALTEGMSQPLSIRLGSQPSAPVTVRLSASNAKISFAPAELVFDPLAWNMPQTLAVSVSDDHRFQTAEVGDLRVSVESLALEYAQLSVTVPYVLTDDDPPPPPFTLSTVPLSPSQQLTFSVQGGATAGATIRLFFNDPLCALAPVATVTADAAGHYVASGFSVGANAAVAISATQEDPNEGLSSCRQLGAFVNDTLPPGDASAVFNPAISAATSARLEADAEAGSRIEVFAGPMCIGQAVASATAIAALSVVQVPITILNTQSTFSVRITDAAGNVGLGCVSATYLHDDVPPATPQVFPTTSPPSPSTSAAVPLAVTISGSAYGDGLRLFRNAACSGTPVAALPAVSDSFSITDPDAPRNQLTIYSVATLDLAGNSACSTSTATFIHDTTPPSPPKLLTATSSQGSITLDWSRGTDPESGVSGYELASCTTNGCVPSFGDFYAIAGDVNTTTLNDIADCTTYTFALRTVSNGGAVSSASNTAEVTAAAQAPSDLKVTPVMGAYEISFADVGADDYLLCFGPAPLPCVSGSTTSLALQTSTRVSMSDASPVHVAVKASYASCASLPSAEVTAQPIGLDAVLQSGAGGTEFGAAVAELDDIDGDGFADFAVGAPKDNLGSGLVVLYSGRTQKIVRKLFPPSGSNLEFGAAVARMGDIDGDGRGEILVGAPGTAADQGAVHLYSSLTFSRLRTFTCSACGSGTKRFGAAIADVGYYDLDTLRDVAIGAPADNGSGSVEVRSLFGGLLDRSEGAQAGAQFGAALAAHGARLLIGAPGANGAFLTSPGDIGTSVPVTAPAGTAACGQSVAIVGDVIGSGNVHGVLGCPSTNANTGAIALYDLADSSTAVATLLGTSAERFGASVSAAGDLDADGRMDIGVGAPAFLSSGTAVGAVRAFSYASGTLRLLAEHKGDATHQNLGLALSGGLDLDGDGLPEMVAGAASSSRMLRAGAQALRAQRAESAEPFGPSGFLAKHMPAAIVATSGQTLIGFLGGQAAYLAERVVTLSAGVLDQTFALFGASPNGSDAGAVDVVRLSDAANRSFETRLLTLAHEASAVQSYDGSTTSAFLGDTAILVGDVGSTPDGVGDFVVGSKRAAGNTGQVTIVDGASLSTRGSFSGTASGDELGAAICAVGDINSDGVPDFVVGAPGGTGAIYGVSGVGAQLIFGPIFGTSPSDAFGASLALVHDMDKDGFPELAVGAPGANAGQGRVSFYRLIGAPSLSGTPLIGTGNGFGSALSAGSDIDGDGAPELAVGAPGGNGAVYVYNGASHAPLGAPILGQSAGDGFGSALASGGDVDGDGFDDLVVGAPGAALGVGAVYVLRGGDRSVLEVIAGTHANGNFGKAVQIIGDVDADGHAELAASAPNASVGGPNTGEAVIYGHPGAPASLTPLYTYSGPTGGSDQGLGASIVRTGDRNADGYADFGFGVPASDSGGTDAGSLFLYHSQAPSDLERPLALSATVVGKTISLAWTSPSPPASYMLQWRTMNGAWSTPELVSGATVATDVVVDASGVYQVRLRAQSLTRSSLAANDLYISVP